MSVREWLNQKPGAAAGLAVALVAVAVGALLFSTGTIGGDEPPGPGDVYYMDLASGALFTGPAGTPPESPDGNAAALAVVFGCGGCDEDQLVVGHLLREFAGDELPPNIDERDATQVSADGSNWFSAASDRGEQITRMPRCEDGSRPRRCHPGR